MSNEGSEQMLSLLKELSIYKALDGGYQASPKGRAETEAYKERERRAAGNKAGNAGARCREQETPALAIAYTVRLPTNFVLSDINTTGKSAQKSGASTDGQS